MRGPFHMHRGGKPEARAARPTTPEQRPFLFPSHTSSDGHKEYPGVIEQVQQFARFNVQPTDLRGRSPKEIVAYARSKGRAEVNLATLQPSEIAIVQQAAELAPDLVTTGNISETSLMQTITTEFVFNPAAQATFNAYIVRMARYPEMLEREYRKFVLGTEETQTVSNPLNAHYLPNLGLPKVQDKSFDALRNQVNEILGKDLEGNPQVRAALQAAIKKQEASQGKSVQNLDLDGKTLVLMYSLLSNFLRGGVFYGFREGSNMEYPPRRIAAEMIHAARAEQEKAMQQPVPSSKRRWGAHN